MMLKWVGSKRQLVRVLSGLMPKEYGSYVEPFVGGGAMMFSVKPTNGIICDRNGDLIEFYKVLRDKPMYLIDTLRGFENTEKFYYEVRAWDRDSGFNKLSDVARASRFYYLNRCGYRGLWRVNKRGENNVPYGWYKKEWTVDEKGLLAMSNQLRGIDIYNGDFEMIKPYLVGGMFVYLDPPYLTKGAEFTSYTADGFTLGDHKRLKAFCDYVDSIGAYFMLSNSYLDEVLSMYSEFSIKSLSTNRLIGNGVGGSKGLEVVITNY